MKTTGIIGVAAIVVMLLGCSGSGVTGVAPATSSVETWAAFVIVDARPLDAQVFLDGRPLGTARDVVAIGLPVQPGHHTVQIVHPGFRPYAAEFWIYPGSYPAIVRAILTPA